jgi:hypothetical protein
MDTAALVDRMVDCFNRHDPEALADGLVQLGLIGPPGPAVGQHPAHEA